MYKVASQKAQTAAHRGKYADWVSASPEKQTVEQRRDDLVRAVQRLDQRITLETDKCRKKKLGLEKLAIQGQLSEVKEELRSRRDPRSLERHFIDVVNERLSKWQFRSLMDEATQRAEAEKLNEATRET